jgi:hypothetical protein
VCQGALFREVDKAPCPLEMLSHHGKHDVQVDSTAQFLRKARSNASGRAAAPRDSGAAHVAFDGRHGLGPCDLDDYVAQSHTPQACCIRFGRAVTGRSRNTRYEAARSPYLGGTLPRGIALASAQRTPTSSESACAPASWLAVLSEGHQSRLRQHQRQG